MRNNEVKSSGMIRQRAPEEEELDKKRAVLDRLERRLAQRELDLATIQAKLRAFDAVHVRTLGRRYAIIDEIVAQIREAEERLHPTDEKVKNPAREARARAHESAEGADETAAKKGNQRKFEPSVSLKSLFWQIAKLIHPDYAKEEGERQRRNGLMAEATRAYAEGNEERLRSILHDWNESADAIKDEGIGFQLIQIVRNISKVRLRLKQLTTDIIELEGSDSNVLRLRVEEAENSGHDLLGEMALKIDNGLANARELLESLS
jgi:hypothetical protein